MTDIIDDNACSSPPICMKEIFVEEDSNLSLPQSESCQNTNDSSDKKIKKSESSRSRLGSRLVVTSEIFITDLHEYRWPPDDNEGHVPCRDKETSDWFVLQEVVSSLLQIKSFKRRYPDLYRRSVDGWEKDWLVKMNMLPKGVGDLGLTALKSDDVLNLLEKDFPEIHEQVVGIFHDRKIQMIADQQKEQYQGICQTAKIEKGSKLDSIRKKSLKSAAEFNKSLNHDRKRERLYYWDLQTMQIHISHNKRSYMTSTPTGANVGPDCTVDNIINTDSLDNYPVSILPGQYCSKFRNYNQYELGYMPINSALYNLPNADVLRSQIATDEIAAELASKSEPVTVNNNNNTNTNNDSNTANNIIILNTNNVTDSVGSDGSGNKAVSMTNNISTNNSVTDNNITNIKPSLCSVCRVQAETPIKCNDCGKSGHPDCMDVKDEMISFVTSYNWSCIDCKKCHNCTLSTDEDRMMFCDRCDRGYHVYCVGLSRIPDGNWICSNCDHV